MLDGERQIYNGLENIVSDTFYELVAELSVNQGGHGLIEIDSNSSQFVLVIYRGVQTGLARGRKGLMVNFLFFALS